MHIVSCPCVFDLWFSKEEVLQFREFLLCGDQNFRQFNVIRSACTVCSNVVRFWEKYFEVYCMSCVHVCVSLFVMDKVTYITCTCIVIDRKLAHSFTIVFHRIAYYYVV